MTSSWTRPDLTHCMNCTHPIESTAKFCGECGASNESSYQNPMPLESAFAQAANRLRMQAQQNGVPSGFVNPTGVPSGFVQPPQNGVPSGFVHQQPNGVPSGMHPMDMINNGPPSGFVQQQPPQNGVPPGFVQQQQPTMQNPQYVPQSMSQPLPQQVMVPNTVSYDDLKQLEAFRLSQFSGVPTAWKPTPSLNPGATLPLPPTGGAPTFAQINAGKNGLSPALINEMQSLNAQIIRERLFLLMHWSIFLVCNLVGFYLALSCYYGCHGDEVTKLVMAFTPLTFINAVALACLSPIKGTRREIMRLLEKKQYVQFQMEYSNLM